MQDAGTDGPRLFRYASQTFGMLYRKGGAGKMTTKARAFLLFESLRLTFERESHRQIPVGNKCKRDEATADLALNMREVQQKNESALHLGQVQRSPKTCRSSQFGGCYRVDTHVVHGKSRRRRYFNRLLTYMYLQAPHLLCDCHARRSSKKNSSHAGTKWLMNQ